ncbi:FkbM family methyltransferase [Amylibacter sp.]|nr:FkbM family methyltransferase [Amylibacter sp.]
MTSIKKLIKFAIISLLRSRYFSGFMSNLNTWPLIKKFGVDNQFIRTWNIFDAEIYISVDIDSYIDQQIIFNKSYIENINFHLIKNVQSNSLYLDIGANVGTTTIPVALLHPNVMVHSFEPNPAINIKLKQHINMNAVNNVTVFDFGLSNKSSTSKFYFSSVKKGNHGTSSLRRNSDISSPAEMDIQLHTVDEHYQDSSIPISLIKIDVQGFEMEVLEGAQHTIKRFKPVILFEQEDQYQVDPEIQKSQFCNFFSCLGYEVFEIDKYDYRNLRNVDWAFKMNANLIALPERHNTIENSR